MPHVVVERLPGGELTLLRREDGEVCVAPGAYRVRRQRPAGVPADQVVLRGPLELAAGQRVEIDLTSLAPSCVDAFSFRSPAAATTAVCIPHMEGPDAAERPVDGATRQVDVTLGR
jgi:hypothetical protein